MGTILGAYIARSGRQIDLINHNRAHIEALKEDGAHVVGTVEFTQPVSALLPEEMTGKYDIIILLPACASLPVPRTASLSPSAVWAPSPTSIWPM